ncbi:MAG: fibronectin type III domain-containing protein [Cyclobacteriaceae bacterium]
MNKVLWLSMMMTFFSSFLLAQHPVMDPSDVVINYDAGAPIEKPSWGTMVKWVRTPRLGWNTDSFKAYFYKGMPFRIKWPANYDPSGNTKYPMIIMLHGRGESGSIYDNEFQMKHGGQKHRDAVDNGTWPGFVVFPQNESGYFGESHYNIINDLINNHFPLLHVDLNRISMHGLSAGGQSSWKYPIQFPRDVAATIPMSAASWSYAEGKDSLQHLQIWVSQGGQDNAPTPGSSFDLTSVMWDIGTNIRYTLYHNLGHGVWNTHYNESDFFPFMERAHKANPTVLTGEPALIYSTNDKDIHDFIPLVDICPNDPINVEMGLSAGFDGYEWRKDGVLIEGASSNTYTATSLGTYDTRIKRGSDWSIWSPIPVVISEKEETQTPDIQIVGLASRVLPAPDGSTSVPVELPNGYIEYSWFEDGTSTPFETNRVISLSVPGIYYANVTEQFGCSSSLSSPFKVVDANGPNKPTAAIGLTGYALSKTKIQLNWSDNPNPAYEETAFEIYRSLASGEDYVLAGITGANVLSFQDSLLNPNTDYHYIIRAVNESGAAPVSTEAKVRTLVDNIAPSAPLNLTLVSKTPNTITLSWDESTDDVGIYKYDVYKGNNKSVVTGTTSATIYNLVEGQVYQFTVKARDFNGNVSAASNQIVASPGFTGLQYKYYQGDWTALPNFNNLTPLDEGVTPNVSIDLAQQNNYFAFYWSGFINIPVAGTYTFETRSDDGSKLYIGSYDESNLVVNNDGLHGMKSETGNHYFSQSGAYPIVITFFERNGGQGMEVYWQSNDAGISRERIPDIVFSDGNSIPDIKPDSPTNFNAIVGGYDNISLSWNDESDDETGFQIYRATSSDGPFTPIVVTAANDTSFIDSGLEPETTYYYQLTALGIYGQSDIIGTNKELIAPINNGIAAIDNANGTGYIMYSEESVHSRFSPSPNGSNSNHFIAIKYVSGEWKYDNNSNYYNFTPQIGDLIIAEVDFSNDLITGLEGISGNINGIESGYSSGDLVFLANYWNGGSNNGEFTVQGTAFYRNTSSIVVVTTDPLPPAPNAPENISAMGLSPSSILIEWDDVSNNEDEFIIYRSANTNTSYLYLTSLPAETTSFLDSGLFSNATYYYKILASNAGGDSTSQEISAVTLNNLPVLDPVNDIVIKINTTLEIPLFAEDIDAESLNYNISNLPSFGSLDDYGDGTGLLTLSPLESDSGYYENVVISIHDQNGGFDADTIAILVDNNNIPTLEPINDIVIDEGDTLLVTLTAMDLDGTDLLTWTHNLPEFASFSPNLDGTAEIHIKPSYTHGGSYLINIEVNDLNGGSAAESFLLTVTEVDPNEEYLINFVYNLNAGLYWNNVNSLTPVNLVDNKGESSSLSFRFITSTWKAFNKGAVTGNNSGVYPDVVIKDYYYFGIFGAPNTVSFKTSGLDPEKVYDFSFFGSSSWTNVPDNGTTIYSIGSDSVSLYVQNNSQNIATLSGISPDLNGEVIVTMNKAPGTPVGYLNAFTIKYVHEAGSLPASPRDLAANYDESTGIELSWIDAPFNETGFEIYRSEDSLNYNLLAVTSANTTNYLDADITDGYTYYYKVRSVNGNGESEFSNISSVELPNVAPSLTLESNYVEMYPGDTVVLTITATDPPANEVTLLLYDAPGFINFEDFGEGDGQITIIPTSSDIGSYTNIQIVAIDNEGAYSSRSLSVDVVEEILYTVSVNFNKDFVAATPWNNTLKTPAANDFFGNLTDENGVNRGMGVRLNTQFGGVFNQGATTGNNSGIVPDNVLKEYYWFGIFGAPETAQIQLEGLNVLGRYNIKFVGSSVYSGSGISDNGETIYKIGNKQVAVDVQANTTTLGTIKDVVPNSSGNVVIDILKGTSASVGYINGLVVEALPATTIDQKPTNLMAEGVSQTAILVSWQDNAYEESGYEIYRSVTGETGPFTLIHTTDEDITSYTETGLSGGTEYTYKVRAKLGGSEYTDYSNVYSAATMAFAVHVNINGDPTYNAPSPWNNIGFLPDNGMIVSNLKDGNNNNTGISLNFVTSLGGENDWGTTTGNNSGVYPDKVLKSFFFMESLEEAEVFIEGLDQSYIYNFRFLGAIETGYTISTKFTINNETVVNWQTNNTSSVSSIIGVEPDIDNKVILHITSGSGSRWSIWNSLVIEAYPNLNSGARVTDEDSDIHSELTIYPNPFSNKLDIKVNANESGEATFSLLDMQGKLLQKFVGKVEKDNQNYFEMIFDEKQLKQGLYLLRIDLNNQSKIHKLIKN